MNHEIRKVGPGTEHGSPRLRTSGHTELTFIGSGSAFSKKYYQNNLLIAKGDEHLLVDCGTRTPEALAMLGLTVMDIGSYLITHSHADHIGGLEEVMLLNRYVAKKKPRLLASPGYRRFLWEKSLRGGCAYNERHDGRWLELADFWDYLEPRRREGAGRELADLQLGSLKLSLYRTKHIPDSARSWRDSSPSYGLVIDDHIAFSSDTRFDPGLFRFWERHFNIDTIFHDCQPFSGGVHASFDELCGLPAATRARTYLMHYGDKVEPEQAIEAGFAGLATQWQTYLFR